MSGDWHQHSAWFWVTRQHVRELDLTTDDVYGRLLDRLAEKSWVERRPDPDDRRVKRVYLTGEVEVLMQTMRAKAAEVRGQAFDGVGQEEQELLISLLVQIKGNLLSSSSNGAGEGDEKQAAGGHG